MNQEIADCKPVIIVGAGPIGLMTALGLAYYKIPFILCEEDGSFSSDTKAGTTLTRTLEILNQYDAAEPVLAKALRVDEIGDIDRKTNTATSSIHTRILDDETRFPFVINMPQHHLEPILAERLNQYGVGEVRLNTRYRCFENSDDKVIVTVEDKDGTKTLEGSYLLACDGGRSLIRDQLGVTVEGTTLDARYLLLDLKVDLDVQSPRDYPYLSYFRDADEWMVCIRQPHCWRFLFPQTDPDYEPDEQELKEKVLRFVGEVGDVELLGKIAYHVHHRVATQWRQGRVFLMGDAAHLITPMWALGMNTGALDAMNMPWRLAYTLRGLATDSLLDGYEREQLPVARDGSGEMAEAARHYMGGEDSEVSKLAAAAWGNAYTRTLLSVRLDVEGSGNWSMIKKTDTPAPLELGDRLPDARVHSPDGKEIRLHDLIEGNFLALYFSDTRRRPSIPSDQTATLKHYAVSRWDAPLDSGLRDRSLLDPGDEFYRRSGLPANTLIVVRPDHHIAAIEPMSSGRSAQQVYQKITAGD